MNTIISIIEKNLQEQRYKNLYYLKNGEEAQALPYRTMIEDAKRLASYFIKNFSPQSRIVLVYPQGIDFITGLLACFYARMVGVPTYPLQNVKHAYRLKKIINSCQPSLILGTSKTIADLASMPDFAPLRMLSAPQILHEAEPADLEIAEHPAPDELAFLQYTSGSTGAPKGVMISHANLLHNLTTLKSGLALAAHKITVSWLPFQHDLGLMTGPLSSLYNANDFVILPPVSVMQNPYLWLKALSDYRAYYTAAPNFAYQLCVDKIGDELLPTLDLSGVGYATAAAEPNRERTVRAFCEKFSRCGFKKEAYCVGYGLAEATVHVTTNTPGQVSRQKQVSYEALSNLQVADPCDNNDMQILMSSGTLCPEHQVVIVNPKTKKRCAAHEVGEIWICSPSIAQGYWDNEEITQKMFQNTLDNTQGRYFRTGDLGFIDGGQLYVTGRLKDLIIVNGRNIYPHDIEEVIEESHPEIKTHGVAVFSTVVQGKEAVIVCAEVKRSAIKKDNAAMLTAIRHAVAESFAIDIADIKLVYPGHSYHTTSGKIQRTATKEAYLRGDLVCVKAVAPVQPQGEGSTHKQELRAILCKVLSVSDIPEDQHFMDLGGTSLHAKMLHQQLQMKFGTQCPISPTIAFECPTLCDLAAYFERLTASS